VSILTNLRERLLRPLWVRLLVGIIHQLGNDSAVDMAASLSYYSLLSIFPLLLGAVAILGYIFPSGLVQTEIFNFFQTRLSIPAALLQDNITSIIALRGPIGILGLFGLFWTGSALFACIDRVTNRIWGIKKYRRFFIRKLRDLFLAVGTSIIFFVSLGLDVIQALLPQSTFWLGLTVGAVVVQIVTLVLVFIVFLLLCKYLPNTRIAWRDVWAGSFLAAFIFEVIRNLFTFYITHFGNFQIVYGSIASVIVFLVWIYFSAFGLIVGIEYNAVRVRLKRETNLVADVKEDH
jgi:membrane protein